MKRFLIAAAVAAATVTTPVLAANVGVSVSIGEPGFYGQIDIGGYPQPQVVYSQPVVIQPVPSGRPPIYLRVPPGYAKHWREHCHEYNACGERVFFVRNGWYNREYVPRYQERHHDHRDDQRGEDHRGNHGNDRHGDDHGHGHDHDH